ncbi:MAG TPA: ABC transporter ATP-binding protein/permease [Candidatus Methylomirabilis sp.]|nr:ABC transporter ATP-binding protein/permease [Candidatus Methylomirabilis sp.]
MESNLYRYIFRRSLRMQVALIVAIFALGLLNPYVLVLTKRTINAIRQMHLNDTLHLLMWYLGAVLATGGLKYLKQNLEGIVSETMLRDLRTELYHRILRFPLPYVRSTSAGQLVAMILGETEDLGQFFGEAFSVPMFNGLMLLGSVGFMLWQNPWLALAALVLFPIQMWLVRKIQRRVIDLSRKRVRLVRGLSDRIQESVGGLQEIHADDTLAYESSGFRGQLRKIFKVRIRIYNLKYLVKWFNNFLEKLGIFFLLLIGGWLIIKHPGSFDLGALVAFIEAFKQLNEPWRELINYIQQRDTSRVKYEQVIVSFDPPGLRPEFPIDERLPEPVPQLAGAYDVRGASVILDGTTRVLDRLQLSTPPYRHVAIVGPTGSGKSTLTMVLARLSGYTGTALLDNMELAQVPSGVVGRQIAYVGSDARLFTGTIFENLVYSLRHRPQGPGGERDGASPDEPGSWLDFSLAGVSDRAGLMAAVLASTRLVALDEDLFTFGLRACIDPAKRPEIAERVLVARRLVMERFEREGKGAVVEFFDRDRFAAYASIGENILFGQSTDPALAMERLAAHDHFRRVIAEVGLQDSLLTLGGEVAREMVEIFKDIPAEHELFSNFSLIAASELPEYVRLLSRLERTDPQALPPEDQERLIALSLRLIPARHRLGHVDEPFMAKVVAARHRFAESLPPGPGTFVPYDRQRYFAQGTLLENLLFGKVLATSSLAVKKVNAIVEEVITTHNLREVVMEAGLDYPVGMAGSRVSPAQRQKVVVARALLKRPQILILDDAFSALEPDKLALMHQRITEAMKGRTVISVVKHPDLVRYYDSVVVLDAGKVAEIGSYQELAAKDGLFRHLLVKASATA